MKILYVCRLYSGFEESLKTGIWNPKGAPTIARMIEHLDSSENHELTILLTAKDVNQTIKSQTIKLENLDTEIKVIAGNGSLPDWLWKFRDKFADIWQLLFITKTYRAVKPDLVYCDRVNIIPAAILARFTKAKILWRVMGILEGMHKSAEQNDWRSSFRKWLWHSPFETVICTLDGSGGGPWMDKALKTNVPRHLLLNGIQKDLKSKKLESLPDKGIKMLFVGRLESLKGIEEFMEAFYEAAPSNPDLVAVIAGDGSLRESLEKDTAAKGLEERVIFLGSITQAQLKYVRQNCDFYVSLNKQGNLSNVNLEALSDHLPAIIPASNPQSGIDIDTDNLIPENVFYRFGKVGDTKALVDAITFMCDDKNRKTYKENATKIADEILPSWETRINQELEIYESIKPKSYDYAIIISDLGSGGAQKVAISLAKDLTAQNKSVLFVTLDNGQNPFFELPEDINHIALNKVESSNNFIKKITSNLGRIYALRKTLKDNKPETVVCFIAPTNILTIAATRGLKTKTIISERNDPTRQSFGKSWDTLRRKTYKYADIITANSPNAVESMKPYVPEKKLRYIPNALPKPDKKYILPHNKKEKIILCVGRLHPQKAHNILLEAFAQIHPDHPDWKLVLIGDGVLRQKLETQAKNLGISESVEFKGILKNPYEYYAKSPIFALPSLYEGTPNALLEAMSCSLTPVISDTCEGAMPYVTHKQSGLITKVQNADDLAQKLSTLINNTTLCETLGQNAIKAVKPLYEKTTFDLWQEALK